MEPTRSEMGPLGTRQGLVKWPWSLVGRPGLSFNGIAAQVGLGHADRTWGKVRADPEPVSSDTPGHPPARSSHKHVDAAGDHPALADEADLLCRQLLAGFMIHGSSARPHPDFARLPGVAPGRPAIDHLDHRHASHVATVRTILEAVAHALQVQCGQESFAIRLAGAVGRRLAHEAVLQSAASDNAARMMSLHVQAGHGVRVPLVDRATDLTVGSLVSGPLNGSTVEGLPEHLFLLYDPHDGHVAYSLGVHGGKAAFHRREIAPEEMPLRCGQIGIPAIRRTAGPSRAQRLSELSAFGTIEKRLTTQIAEAATWDRASSLVATVLARKLSLRLMSGLIDTRRPHAADTVRSLVQDTALDVLNVTMPHVFDAFRPVMTDLVRGLNKTIETANRAAGTSDALQLDTCGLCRVEPGLLTDLAQKAARMPMTRAV